MKDDSAAGRLPRLRPIDIVPVEQHGRRMLMLRDPSGLTQSVVVVTSSMLVILQMLDGEHTVREVQTAIARHTGELVRSDHIEQIIAQLDEALLLDTPRLAEFREQALAEYRASGVRPCTRAEGAFPTDPAAFAQMAEGWLEGLPAREAPATGRLVGVVAPHIDFQRGAVGYAHAYRDIRDHCDADLFVILGTDHHGDMQFAATRNTFQTPLGDVPVARDALARLQLQFVGDLFEGELQHVGEHTIEFQAVLLRHFLGKHDFEIIPILCGGLSEELLAGETEVQDAETLSMVDCLRDLVAASDRKACVIASADLSHVGPRFGLNRPLTGSVLQKAEQHDREVLGHAVSAEPDAMFAVVGERRNDTNICGLMPIYIMLKALGECAGDLLHYEQATSPDRQQSVSFAAATFWQ